jgi:hypothetical protein
VLADRGTNVRVHREQNRADDAHRREVRHTPAVHEGDGEAAAFQLVGDLRPGAVHDDDVVALELRERRGRVPRDGAADLEDDQAHRLFFGR